MAIKNFITLDNLATYDSLIKQVISDEDAKSIKAAALNNKKLELYTVENPTSSDTPRFSIALPFTQQEMQGPNGKAIVWNESDGGGVKFEHSDGTWSFVGVNDGGENGITGQIYSVKKNANEKYEGTRINLTSNGFFYTRKDSSTYSANDEIATKGDIAAISSADKTVYLKDESSGQSEYAKVYKLYQGADASDMTQNVFVGQINIPKDLFIKSAYVGTVNVDDSPYEGAKVGDKYIAIEVQNQSEILYIPANSLVDVYTGGTTAEISVSVSNNQITASIVEIDGSKIADGSITRAKLDQAVQDSLDLADGSLQQDDIDAVSEEDIRSLFE